MNNLCLLPHRIEAYNCYDNNIIFPISKLWSRNIDQYFLNDFGFTIVGDYDVRKRLVSTGNDFSNILLRDFSGVTLESIDTTNMELLYFIKIVETNIVKNKPIGIKSDSYYCPWSKYYRSVHMEHYFLIMGMVNNKYVNCIDSYFSNQIQSMSVELVLDTIKEIILFNDVGNTYNNSINKLDQYILQSLSYDTYEKRYDSVMRLSCLLSYNNIEKEMSRIEKDPNRSTILFSIDYVMKSRKNFYNTLTINNKNNIVFIPEKLLIDLKEIIRYWEVVKGLIIKNLITSNKSYSDKMNGLISLLAEKESLLHKELILHFNN